MYSLVAITGFHLEARSTQGISTLIKPQMQLDSFDFGEVASSCRPLFPQVATLNRSRFGTTDLETDVAHLSIRCT